MIDQATKQALDFLARWTDDNLAAMEAVAIERGVVRRPGERAPDLQRVAAEARLDRREWRKAHEAWLAS